MFDHPEDAGPSLALMARMAIALGCEAGMVNPQTLCIELSYGRPLTWHIPEPLLALFDGLPPYTRPLEPEDATQRNEILNQAFALPKDWLLRCAAKLEAQRGYGNVAWHTTAATEVWREPGLRGLDPETAATWWQQDVGQRGKWAAQYAALTAPADGPYAALHLSAPDDNDESALVEALTPLYKAITPEAVFQLREARNSAYRMQLTDEQRREIEAQRAADRLALQQDEAEDAREAELERLAQTTATPAPMA